MRCVGISRGQWERGDVLDKQMWNKKTDRGNALSHLLMADGLTKQDLSVHRDQAYVPEDVTQLMMRGVAIINVDDMKVEHTNIAKMILLINYAGGVPDEHREHTLIHVFKQLNYKLTFTD